MPAASDRAGGDGDRRRPDAVPAAAAGAVQRHLPAAVGPVRVEEQDAHPGYAGPGVAGAHPEGHDLRLDADVDAGRRHGEGATRRGLIGAAAHRDGPVRVLECAERRPAVAADVHDAVDHTGLQPPRGAAEPARDGEGAAPAAVGGGARDALEQHRGRALVVPGRDEDPFHAGPPVGDACRHGHVRRLAAGVDRGPAEAEGHQPGCQRIQVVHGQVRGVRARHAPARHGKLCRPGIAGTGQHPHRVLRRDLPLRSPQLGQDPADADRRTGAAGVRDGDRQGHDSGTSRGVDCGGGGRRRADDRVTVVGRHAAGQCGRSGGRAARRTGEKGQGDDDGRRDDAPGPPHVPHPALRCR